MHRSFIAFLALLTVGLFACSNNKWYAYEVDGVGFNIPKGWNIRQEGGPDGPEVVTIEKAGNDESGLAVITVYNTVYDASDALENTRAAMMQNPVYSKSGITFTEMTGGKFLNGRSLSMNFTFKDAESGHSGSISVFELCNKTVTVMMQQHEADRNRNAEGFEILTNSFNCKK